MKKKTLIKSYCHYAQGGGGEKALIALPIRKELCFAAYLNHSLFFFFIHTHHFQYFDLLLNLYFKARQSKVNIFRLRFRVFTKMFKMVI